MGYNYDSEDGFVQDSDLEYFKKLEKSHKELLFWADKTRLGNVKKLVCNIIGLWKLSKNVKLWPHELVMS